MQVPQNQNLHSQSFNSKFIEFVWLFDITPITKNQIIFKVFKNGDVFLQEDEVNLENEVVKDGYITSGILSTKNIPYEILYALKEQSVKYLNEP